MEHSRFDCHPGIYTKIPTLHKEYNNSFPVNVKQQNKKKGMEGME